MKKNSNGDKLTLTLKLDLRKKELLLDLRELVNLD